MKPGECSCGGPPSAELKSTLQKPKSSPSSSSDMVVLCWHGVYACAALEPYTTAGTCSPAVVDDSSDSGPRCRMVALRFSLAMGSSVCFGLFRFHQSFLVLDRDTVAGIVVLIAFGNAPPVLLLVCPSPRSGDRSQTTKRLELLWMAVLGFFQNCHHFLVCVDTKT